MGNPAGYKVTSVHAEDLASGRVAAVGELLPADAVDPDSDHDARLIAEGRLLVVEAPPKAQPKTKGAKDPEPDPDAAGAGDPEEVEG